MKRHDLVILNHLYVLALIFLQAIKPRQGGEGAVLLAFHHMTARRPLWFVRAFLKHPWPFRTDGQAEREKAILVR